MFSTLFIHIFKVKNLEKGMIEQTRRKGIKQKSSKVR